MNCPADVLVRQLAEARALIPDGARWVVAAHAFVQGGSVTEAERSLDFVGGVETVPHEVFNGAAYVALGHLHRGQSAGAEHIRYCGAPMAFGFDEAGANKTFSIVDLGATGPIVETRDLKPRRVVRVIEGRLDDLLGQAGGTPSQDFIKAILLDEGDLIDPMGQLRALYPNALQIARPERAGRTGAAGVTPSQARRDPMDVLDAFLHDVRGEGLLEIERPIAQAALTLIDEAF